MGKFTGLKSTLERAPEDPSFQEKVNAEKTKLGFDNLNQAKIASILCAADDQKDKLEDLLKRQSLIIEAASQYLVDKFETEGITQIKLKSGDTCYIKDSPYCTVEDKQKWLEYVKNNGMEDLLSVHYQTMNGMVTELLLKGKPIPPGIKAFIKSKITRLKPRKTE